MAQARVSSRSVGTLVRQRLGVGEDDWDLALVQRDRVWNHQRTRRLMDSLLAGYPIGSLLTCSVPHAGKGMDPVTRQVTEVDADRDQLLDGQQRIAAMTSLFSGSGDAGRFFLDMTAVRKQAILAKTQKDKDDLTAYIKWRADDNELAYKPIKDRERFVDLGAFAEWAGLADALDVKTNAALAAVDGALDNPETDDAALREATAFLSDLDSEYVAPIGTEDLRRSAEQASRLLRAWLREVPVERHVFGDKMDILEAFERVNLEGVKVAGDDIFFAAVKTAWPGADRALASVVAKLGVITRMGALRLLARLAALSIGQGDLLPLRVDRLNGKPGDDLVARLVQMTADGSPSVRRMQLVADALTGADGPGHALKFIPGPLWDDVLAWAAANSSLDAVPTLTVEQRTTLATYLVGAATHQYWQIFGEPFATRSIRFAVDAGLAGHHFPVDAILAKVRERWPELRQGARVAPPQGDLANRNREIFLCMAQQIPFNLPLRQPSDPARPNDRVQIEWDHIWPQAKTRTLRIRRAATEGSRSVNRVGNFWALDRPLNTSASDGWPSEKLAFLADPQAKRPHMPTRWPEEASAFLQESEQAMLLGAERAVRGDGVPADVPAAAETFAMFVARRTERITAAVLEQLPAIEAFGVKADPAVEVDPTPSPRPEPAAVAEALGLSAVPVVEIVRRDQPSWGTHEMAQEMGLGEDFVVLVNAARDAGLRVVDYHRDGKPRWAKVGLADAGKQARTLFWIVPEWSGASPVLAVPHSLPNIRDLLGIAPEVTRRLFGSGRPHVHRGGAADYVDANLGEFLKLVTRGVP